tara:strand:+ start:952 stop:1242 length:291 start_codon:yes stop_codon:yes gene_type:complete
MKTNKNQIVDGIELSEGVEFIPEFHSTEVDLDRDVPSEAAFFKFNNMVDTEEEDMITGHFDVDVDEDGPFITSSFDDYCDAHPDFNAALNGHWEHV